MSLSIGVCAKVVAVNPEQITKMHIRIRCAIFQSTLYLVRMKRKGIIFIHFITWLLLSVAYFFMSEMIVVWIAPGSHDVSLWLITLFAGQVILTILTVLSLIICLKRKLPLSNRLPNGNAV